MPRKRKTEVEDSEGKQKRGRKKGANGANGDHSAAAVPFEDNEDDEESEIVLEGSMVSGELLISGGTNWDLIGRNQVPKGVKNLGGRNLWSAHRVKQLCSVKVRTVVSGCTACHSIAITNEGKVYSWGRNTCAQLGHGDTIRKDVPTLIESLSSFNIVDAACGKNHTLCLTDKGHVYAFGDNKMAQLGLGHQSPFIPSPTRIQYRGPPIRRLACGAEFGMIVDVRGNLYSFGCPENGQLGHNTDGKYFVSSSKMTFSCEMKPRKVQVFIEKTHEGHILPVTDVEVVDVACGTNHSVICDRKKRVFTWGFGGYGRLGHSEPRDEWVPRMLKYFEGPNRGVKMITAGASFSMAVNELGVLYLWGQNKPTGEAAMYPKPVQDLSGWQVRSIGCCNRSIVVAADESMVSWGPSPTYGELGYGDNKPKSSTVPQEVKPLSEIYIHRVACGYGHALMIARVDTDEERERVERLPSYGGP
ncbi:hypothetical protein NP493_403g00025 [Ridgeia piscesae]|uniref:Protein RCC2 homolog n=1 Tax=Ridgeia piscesae TaxID=27915 RepID=A0AAD9L1L5_RIDPI|nr:hypothetical protein NP493_403g00025 [Ridgeia piscesae]